MPFSASAKAPPPPPCGPASIRALGATATALLIDQPLGAPLGAVLATFHRFTLALLRPMAF